MIGRACVPTSLHKVVVRGGALNFFWWVCATRVSKIGSTEQIFFPLNTRVLRTNFFVKVWCVLELKFCLNQREIGIKMLNFSKNGKRRGTRTDTTCRCKKGGSLEWRRSLKRGVVKATHTRIPLTCECPLPRVVCLDF